MLEELHDPLSPLLVRDRADHFDNVPEFHQSFYESTKTVMHRQMKIPARNTAFIATRAIMILVLGFLNGTVFWQLNANETQIILGVLFQSVLLLGLGQFAQVPTFFAARKIFYKQRGTNFYRTSSYVLEFTVSQIPLAIAETVVFGSMIYWMCGLVSQVGAFIIFELLILLTMLTFTALFFFFSCATPNLNVAQPVAMVILTFIILYGGFAISEGQMPDALVWIYWIDPVTWTLRALAINQYTASKFDVPVYDGIDYMEKYGKTMGHYSLELVGVKTEKYWLWLAFAYNGTLFVLYLLASYAALEYHRFEQPENIGLAKNSDDDDALSVATSPVSSVGSYVMAHTPVARSADETVLDVTPSHAPQRATAVALAFKDHATHKYALEAVTSVVFGNCKSDHPERDAYNVVQDVPPTVPAGLKVEEFIDVVYNMKHDHLAHDFGVLVGVAVGFGLVTLFAMRFVNLQTK